MIKQSRALNKNEIIELDRFLPQIHSNDEDVVEFDNFGNVKLDSKGMPIKNWSLFGQMKSAFRKLPAGIPTDPKKYTSYMNKYIGVWRDKGVLPR